ncbi:MAG TPA: alpha-hydroxy acid oxidase [Gaiellaceae bacterium]|nr:alpha-hydroxy acid oxidase [Gaiellaceae bacterium]
MSEPVNVWDYERLAEGKVDPGPWGYFAGGAGDEHTLADNVASFQRWRLRPRMLVDVGEVTTATTVLDRDVSMPVLVAPTAFQRLAHPDGELATARAAAAAGTVMCLSTLGGASPAELAAAAPDGRRWFQLYWSRDRGFTQGLVESAEAAGFEAIVLTVDLPAAGRRERDLRAAFEIPPDLPLPNLAAHLGGGDFHATLGEVVDPTITWRDLEWLHSISSLPLILKGVLTAEDARLACEQGVAGVVVSNHGGRQLDRVPASLDVLPEVVDAVAGRCRVFMDGGIRRGTDVVTALALGARAVLVGRPLLWGLAVDGEAGVLRVLELLRAEIELALRLLGCPNPEAVTRAHVRRSA